MGIPRSFKISKIPEADFARCTIFCNISKIPKVDLLRNTEIPRSSPNSSKFSKTYRSLFKHILDLLGFIEIPRSSEMFQDLKNVINIPEYRVPFLSKTIVNASCFGPTELESSICLIPHPFPTLKIPTLPTPTFQSIRFRQCFSDFPQMLNVKSSFVY